MNNNTSSYKIRYNLRQLVPVLYISLLNLLLVCGEVNCCIWKQPETGDHIPFPKSSKSLILVDDDKSLQKSAFAVKSSHLTFNLHDLQRRRDGFAEETSETRAEEALRTGQPGVVFHRDHHYFSGCLA